MRIRVFAAAGGAVGLVLALSGSALAQPSLTDQINSLQVAAEDRSGYDRDAFGDYDRDALLERNFAAWPNCDGYYSRYDDQCYEVGGGTSKEEADNEVDVDHTVALAEAWDSGISQGDLEAFGGDPANLALMTDNLNQSKGDQDIAEWQPTHRLCAYVTTYVAVKVNYELSVDQTEKQALLDLAGQCDSGSTGGGNGSGSNGDDEPADNKPSHTPTDDEVSKAPEPEPVENDLAVTG